MQLSVIVVAHNSFHVLPRCLELLRTQLCQNFPNPKEYEVVVVDNASTDGTVSYLKKQKDIMSVYLPENIGFGRGNNAGAAVAHGAYLLLLNSDVYLEHSIDFQVLLSFLEKDSKRAALAIKLNLPDGRMDRACHRGFPTPLNSFVYFSRLEKLIGGTYHLTNRDLTTIHEIDCPSAAFFLIKKNVFDEVKGFDPDYFFYAEDIDLCYRVKEKKYSIWFYPSFQAQHLKYQSGQKGADTVVRLKSRVHFFSSMGMFYEKHYSNKYPKLVAVLVKCGIRILALFNK
jgi:GT2 family glycosyltransferase